MIADFRPGKRLSLFSTVLIAIIALVGLTDAQQAREVDLKPLKGLTQVTVLQPDGQPAREAHLWADDGSTFGLLRLDKGFYFGPEMIEASGDENGRLSLPAAKDSAPVAITHPSGVFETTMKSLHSNPVVQLTGFGVVEGRVLLGGKPKQGAMVRLSSPVHRPKRAMRSSYDTSTDAAGRFVFTNVPQGEYRLCQWVLPVRSDNARRAIIPTRQMYVTVHENRTNMVEYSRPSRLITGQALPRNPQLGVDWNHDVHTLSLKLPSDKTPAIQQQDFATEEAFEKAKQARMEASHNAQEERKALTYALEFNPDGSFRVEDVQPGTYELKIRVTKDQQTIAPVDGEVLGILIKEVVVGKGSAPLDLGKLTLDISPDGHP